MVIKIKINLFLVFDDLDNLPPVAFSILLLVGGHVRTHMLLDEAANTIAPIDLTFGRLEIHRGSLSFLFAIESVV